MEDEERNITPKIVKELEERILPLKIEFPWLGILIYDTSIVKTRGDLQKHIKINMDKNLKMKWGTTQ